MSERSSTDFDPGEGWRHASDEEAQEGSVETVMHYSLKSGWTNWVREEPVPPLPTEPNTTIAITAANGASILDDPVFTLRQMSAGLRWWNERGPHTVEWLQERITGFEVLSEPRAVTAKAVIQALEHGKGIYSERVAEVEREFGITS